MPLCLAFFPASIANASLELRLTGGEIIHQSGRKNTPLILRGKTCHLRTSLPLNAEGRASRIRRLLLSSTGGRKQGHWATPSP